jgi:hypothetical protein
LHRQEALVRRILIISAVLAFVAIPGAPAQVLGVSGDRFTVDGHRKFLLFISYFDGLRRANADGKNTGDLDTDFSYVKRIGLDGLRLFPNWRYDCGGGPRDGQQLFTVAGSINETMWAVFIRFLNTAAAHRLLVDVTFTRDTYPNGAIQEAVYQNAIVTVAQRLRDSGGHRNVLFDVHNEYSLHGLKPEAIARIINAVHRVDPARIATASGAGGEIANDAVMNVLAYHDARTGDWYTSAVLRKRLDAIRGAMSPGVKPIYFQEPMPFRLFNGCGHSYDAAPKHARQAAQNARRWGAAAWTFHTRQSFGLAASTLLNALKADPLQKAEVDALGAANRAK